MDSYSENTQDNSGGDDDALSSLLLLLKANSGTESNEGGYPPGPYKSPRKSMYASDDRMVQEGDSMSLSNSLTIEALRGYFHLPIVEVAKQLGTCTTALKKICRKHKIRKWPYRQIRSLTKSIQSLEMASLNDTMGDEVRDQYREQIVTLQKAIDDIVFDPNTNISALAKKLEAEWGAEGAEDRILDTEPSDSVRQIIQAAAATVGMEGSGNSKSSQAKRKLNQMETLHEGGSRNGPESSQSTGQSSSFSQSSMRPQGSQDSSSQLLSGQNEQNSGPSSNLGGLYRSEVPKKVPEVSIGLTQVNQVAFSVSDHSKNTGFHFIGPVILAPLERRRINKLTSKKLVPLIEPDICNHFKMEFLPQGPLLQVRFCQPRGRIPGGYNHDPNQSNQGSDVASQGEQGGEGAHGSSLTVSHSTELQQEQQQQSSQPEQPHMTQQHTSQDMQTSEQSPPPPPQNMPAEAGGGMEEAPQHDESSAQRPTGSEPVDDSGNTEGSANGAWGHQ